MKDITTYFVLDNQAHMLAILELPVDGNIVDGVVNFAPKHEKDIRRFVHKTTKIYKEKFTNNKGIISARSYNEGYLTQRFIGTANSAVRSYPANNVKNAVVHLKMAFKQHLDKEEHVVIPEKYHFTTNVISDTYVSELTVPTIGMGIYMNSGTHDRDYIAEIVFDLRIRDRDIEDSEDFIMANYDVALADVFEHIESLAEKAGMPEIEDEEVKMKLGACIEEHAKKFVPISWTNVIESVKEALTRVYDSRRANPGSESRDIVGVAIHLTEGPSVKAVVFQTTEKTSDPEAEVGRGFVSNPENIEVTILLEA